jgi:hypothetical protein
MHRTTSVRKAAFLVLDIKTPDTRCSIERHVVSDRLILAGLWRWHYERQRRQVIAISNRWAMMLSTITCPGPAQDSPDSDRAVDSRLEGHITRFGVACLQKRPGASSDYCFRRVRPKASVLRLT